MSRALKANCAAGTVTAEGVVVPGADILSEGVGPSEGLLLLDEHDATYVTSNAADLKATLDAVAQALTKVATALTSIGAGMTGPTTAPPPTLAVDVAAIVTLTAALTTLKGALK